jgi:exodeoxyribonuclease VII small subunit
MTPTPKGADADDGVAALTYSEASAELDTIIEEFEAGVIDVDRLVERLERATSIVDELDRRLRRTRMQVEELVPRLEAVGRSEGEAVEIEVVEEFDIIEIDGESDGDAPTGLF